jgi:hypothetical protein
MPSQLVWSVEVFVYYSDLVHKLHHIVFFQPLFKLQPFVNLFISFLALCLNINKTKDDWIRR